MKKITFLFLLFSSFIYAQVSVNENFDSGTPTGWTDSYSNTTIQTCAGNSERDNLWSSSTTGNLTSPNQAAASNGTDLTISFDYKIVDYSAATNPTPAGWGTAEVQYSTDDGATWTTVYTIDDSNHTVANTCAAVSATVPAASLPNGSDVKLRIANTWASGDYYFYVDNFSANQVASNPPNCDSNLTSINVAGDITWSAATGIPTGYKLTVGTTSGGNDILNNVDVGDVLTYNAGALSVGSTYYVTIVPYNANGDATGCTEQSQTVPCLDPTGASATNVTFESADLAWTENNGASTWNVEWGSDGFTQGSGTLITGTTTNPHPLSGLTASTAYDFYVQTDCGGGTSAWVGPISFTTPGVPPANDDCSGVISLDSETSPLTATTVNATNDFGQNCLTNSGAPDVVYSITVPDGQRLTISQQSNAYDSKHRIAYGATCPGDTLIACTDDPDTEETVWDNTTGSSQTVYWIQSAFSTGSGEFVLQWNLAQSPTCEVVTGVTVSQEDVQANLSWTAPTVGTPTGYNWEIQPDGSAQGTAGAITGTTATTSATATGLMASTAYDLFVQTNCGGDGTSNWVGPISFTTNAGPPPTNNLCSGAIALTPGVNFAANAIVGTNVNASNSNAQPAPGCASYQGGDVWYSVVVPQDGNITLEVNTQTGGITDTGGAAYSGTCGNLTLISCNDDGSANGAHPILNISDTNLAGQTIYFRVWEYGGNAEGEFQVSAYNTTLSTATFESQNTFKYYPNPTNDKLHLRAQNNIQNVTVFNMLGQEVLRTAPNAVENDVDMSALQTGAYFVKVTINNVTETVRVVKQ